MGMIIVWIFGILANIFSAINSVLSFIMLSAGIYFGFSENLWNYRSLILLAVFGALLLIELLAFCSFHPESRFFNKIGAQILVLVSRVIWSAGAGFVFYILLYDPPVGDNVLRYYNQSVIILIWLLLYNVLGAMYRLALCFKPVRTRLINYHAQTQARLENEPDEEKSV